MSQKPPTRETTEADYRDLITGYIHNYSIANPKNPVGKHFKNFTASDFSKIRSDDLQVLRFMVQDEKYNHLDEIIPQGMTRPEFARNILRELAKRREIAFPYNGFPTKNRDTQNREITVIRSQVYGDGTEAPVTELVGNLVIRDGFIAMISPGSAPGLVLSRDVGEQIGETKPLYYPVNTDAHAYDVGYTVGSMPEFTKDNPLRLRLIFAPDPKQTEQLEAQQEIELAKAKTDEERAAIRANIRAIGRTLAQGAYCNKVTAMFAAGRAATNQEAAELGYFQARSDNAEDFGTANRERVGVFSQCRQQKAR